MTPSPSQIRSLYRSILRELPHRPLSSRSPTHQRIRHSFSDAQNRDASNAVQQCEQFVHYIKAQRMYSTLLERYNPGMSMDEEEKVRLSARRVGMNMPQMWSGEKN